MQPKPIRLMDHREFPVLYVDDEPDNLRIFELTFRRQFTILTASSPEEGLRILHENPVAIILSDYRMPGMTGVEFLSQAREIDDSCIRMLVTAYGDVEILGDAINDGRIYRYVPKPWEPDDMGLTIRRAIETYAIERERSALLNELLLINRLSQALHRELDMEKLVRLCLDALHRELHFDGVSVGLLDRACERLQWLGHVPVDEVSERLRQLELTRENAPGFFERMLEGHTQVLKIDDEHLDEPIRDWVTEVSADEVVAVPLIGEQAVIGVMAVDQRRGGKHFGADERTLLDGMATQTTIAIENARVVEALRSSREQLKRADRLGTLGTLSAGLAHEINNPLVALRTFMELAPEKRSSHDEEFWGPYHELACSELERIRVLVATMGSLVQGGMEEMPIESVDLADLANRVVLLTQGQAREEGVEIEMRGGENLVPIYGVRDQLHQVLLNILCNAVDASPEGSTVEVAVEADRDHPRDVMCFTITDAGDGIPEAHMEQIFDPFFTTKSPDRGTGLGLMVTHQIVADHGGAIEVKNAPGKGASFRVKLPVKGHPGAETAAANPGLPS